MLWQSIGSLVLLLTSAFAHDHGRLGNLQRDRLARHAEMQSKRFGGGKEKRQASYSSFRFLNNKTEQFQVKSLPYVNYDIGEMYSGLIPVAKDKSRALFFVFQPTVGAPVDEVTIWLNGGPGCSSLEGFLQENGLFRWEWGVHRPLLNPYSWVNLTNMLWVEQPVGTGFSIGKRTARNEDDISADFVSWFKNFQVQFGIQNFKIYITGESYAGRYVPYISYAMLQKKNKQYYDVNGILVYDPCIGDCGQRQIETVSYPFIEKNANLFNFNTSYTAQLAAAHQSCGYQKYIDTYLTFPPSGVQPQDTNVPSNCAINEASSNVALQINPCYNPYEMVGMCPLLWDVLGFPTYLEYEAPQWTNYFQQKAVKEAMHAPMDVTWNECSFKPVFPHGDSSPDPIQKVLPAVIEATNRVLVANGDYDYVVITDGTLLAIQNMTWNGKLGFQTKPSTPVDIQLVELEYASVLENNGVTPTGQGIMGVQHQERGLLFTETYMSGHMQPQFQARAAYRHLQWVLGHIDSL